VERRWSIDETYVRIVGRWCYAFRAIYEERQVIDVYVSPMRDTAAATTFLTQAVESSEVTPYRATTDKAPIYPPAFTAVLPEVKHVTGKMEQQRIERDHTIPVGDRRLPQAPRLVHAWDELTLMLAAA